MSRILVLDDDRSLMHEAIERLMMRDAVRDVLLQEVPMTIRLVDRHPPESFHFPIYLPREADEPKVGKVFHAGRYGAMPIPSGKRKKFKPSRQKRGK